MQNPIPVNGSIEITDSALTVISGILGFRPTNGMKKPKRVPCVEWRRRLRRRLGERTCDRDANVEDRRRVSIEPLDVDF